jgi:hypothetical protein
MPSQMVWRGAIVASALVAAAGIIHAGIAQRLAQSDPVAAARVAPYDARIAMAAARKLVEDGRGAIDPAIRVLTQATLARDLTQNAAIEFRAVDVEAAGNRARAAQLFDLSDAISRRSLPTRLWLIQRSVDRGDVGHALRDFDVALRTTAAAAPTLFPVLAGATSDPGLVMPIARMLDRPSDWRLLFLNYAVANGDIEGAAAVLLHMRDRGLITGNGLDRALVARLVDERRFALAGRVRVAFPAGQAQPRLVVDGGFADATGSYPFGWSFTERGDIGAERSIANGRPALGWRSEPGRGGQVAAQLLLLSPGNYRLATMAASATPDDAPYWSLSCGEQGGATLARLDVPSASSAAAAVNVAVPVGCEGQWLTLTLRPGGTSGERAGAIASVAITRR